MTDEERDMLLDYLIDMERDSFSLSYRDFVDGFEFKGFGNMNDDELIEEGFNYGLEEEDEWFKAIVVNNELRKEIAKAK